MAIMYYIELPADIKELHQDKEGFHYFTLEEKVYKLHELITFADKNCFKDGNLSLSVTPSNCPTEDKRYVEYLYDKEKHDKPSTHAQLVNGKEKAQFNQRMSGQKPFFSQLTERQKQDKHIAEKNQRRRHNRWHKGPGSY